MAPIMLLVHAIDSGSGLIAGVEPYRRLSPFYCYIGSDPLVNGLDLNHVLVLIARTVICVGLALWLFERRDLANKRCDAAG